MADALVMAIWRRGKPDALLHHSDRGFSQYTSEAVPSVSYFARSRRRLPDEPFRQRLGHFAAMSASSRHSKTERLSAQDSYRTRDEARSDVFALHFDMLLP